MAHLVEDMIDSDFDESDYDDDQYQHDVWTTFPQKKRNTTMKSLQEISIENICTNINYWMEYLPENAFEYHYIINPFDVLSKVPVYI